MITIEKNNFEKQNNSSYFNNLIIQTTNDDISILLNDLSFILQKSKLYNECISFKKFLIYSDYALLLLKNKVNQEIKYVKKTNYIKDNFDLNFLLLVFIIRYN